MVVIASACSSRRYETTTGLKKKLDSRILSTYGGELKAFDPKDHIYGLLGITELEIIPDYSTHKSVPDVYTEYVVAWLEVQRNPNSPYDKLNLLYFLKKARSGLFGRTVGFPTWAPNYFENSKHPTPPSRTPQEKKRLIMANFLTSFKTLYLVTQYTSLGFRDRKRFTG
jgi:hypothetical protein